jgi:REP-associated tyrosine transposase
MAKANGQVEIKFRTWGGKRRGAGRPAKKPWRPSERHKLRARFAKTTPLHVTLRVVDAIGKLRRRDAYHAIRRAMQATLARTDFRIVHISLEDDHIHLIVEADTERALAKGMQAFEISAAIRLNVAFSKRGRRRYGQVFADRYHPVVITSPTQARHAIAYVLNNWRRHRQDNGMESRLWTVDYFSSGPSFRGWKECDASPMPFDMPPTYEPLPVATPQTWLLGAGWRKTGRPISLREVPGPAPR